MVEDWRRIALAQVRKLIAEADPEAVEEIKWRKSSNPDGVPAWSHHGLICTGEIYRNKVKLTFAKGAALPDPAKLFVPQEGGTRRAMDLHEGDTLNPKAFIALVQAAVALNREGKKK